MGRGASFRGIWSPNDGPNGGSSSAYRPPSVRNNNHPSLRRTASTGGTTTGKFENENGTVSGTVNVSAVGGPSNSFLPEWADDDDSDTEVGVFDSSGAFVSVSVFIFL